MKIDKYIRELEGEGGMHGRAGGTGGQGGALCVEMGFTWTFPRNQDAKVKLKSELISIKF